MRRGFMVGFRVVGGLNCFTPKVVHPFTPPYAGMWDCGISLNTVKKTNARSGIQVNSKVVRSFDGNPTHLGAGKILHFP